MNYPSWRYHAIEEPRIIHTPDDEAEGWHPSPAHHGIETAPGREPDPEIAASRPDPESNEPASDPKPKRGRKAAK